MKGGSQMSEQKLVLEAKAGNKASLEQLLILHSDQLYRTAYVYVGNREDALDVVQETAYRAILSIKKLRNEQYFLTWLTRILIHCAYDLLKKKKREIPIEKMIEQTLDKREGNIELLDLVEALNKLKEHYRTSIILFYFQDQPIREIAKIMDIPENTVKTYLRRGKDQLKKMLGGVEYDEKTIFPRRV